MALKGLVSRLCFAFVCLGIFSACGNQPSSTSDTKIIGGLDAQPGQFPEVVRITHGNSGCSASFVSAYTLLTAAHCLEGSGPVRVGENSSNNYYLHPRYGQQWWNHDIAVVHFEQPISDYHLTVAVAAPNQGDELTIVGFGTDNLYGSGSFRKRYGYNTIERVSQGRLVFRGKDRPEQAPAGEDVLSASGDSGGPMIVGDYQVGVSSSISVEPQGQGRNGFYTNINYGPNRAFLEELVQRGDAIIDFQ